MDIGDLDRRIKIQQNTPAAPNEFGEREPVWSDFATVWAQLRPLRGKEAMAAGAETQQHTTVFRIRYRRDITPEMCVVYNGRSYDIENIQEPQGMRGQYLDIEATAREVASGNTNG